MNNIADLDIPDDVWNTLIIHYSRTPNINTADLKHKRMMLKMMDCPSPLIEELCQSSEVKHEQIWKMKKQYQENRNKMDIRKSNEHDPEYEETEIFISDVDCPDALRKLNEQIDAERNGLEERMLIYGMQRGFIESELARVPKVCTTDLS